MRYVTSYKRTMLGDISGVDQIYIACGYTDMRKSVDGLMEIIINGMQLDPFSNSLFLFCDKKRDRMKALLWEKMLVMTEMVTLLTKQKFGSSSEKTTTKEMEGQLFLFNEVEVESDLNVDGITRCGCWSHLRRYFVEAMPPGSEKTLQLFTLLNPELRKQKRLEQETPVFEAFWSWVTSLNPLNGSKLAKAITYEKNQRTYLENYLLDGRCVLSNNLAENSIRPFTIGRKNWLFSTNPKGVTAGAATYSIVETAKANNLDVYKYLQYLLSYMPDTDYKNSQAELEELMPWSKEMQTVFYPFLKTLLTQLSITIIVNNGE